MGGLTPTVITDKNGKITTVHRKTDTVKQTKTVMPSPTVPDEDLKNLIADVTVVVYQELDGGSAAAYSNREIARAVENIKSYPRELLGMLHETLSTHSPSCRTLSKLIQSGRVSNEVLYECAYFSPKLVVHPSASMDAIRGLRYYSELPRMDNYALSDEETQTRIVSLLNVVVAVDGVCDGMRENPLRWAGDQMIPVLKDDRLVELVWNNPDKAEVISRFIEDRMTVDFDAILEVVRNDSNSLAEGLL